MRAAVGVRPAPHRVVDDDGRARPYRFHLGLEDRVAVEAALRTADEVVAVGVGGDAARSSVRSALETGVDEGVLVAFDPVDEVLGEKYATVLARAAAREDADLLVLGESSPFMGGEVVGLAAETLGWPSASRVTAVGVENLDVDVDRDRDRDAGANASGDPESEAETDADADAEAASIPEGGLALQRKLAIGRQEALAVDPPAVLGIDGGFDNPRRAPLDVVIAGRRAAIDEVPLEDVAPGESRFSMSVGRATVEDVVPNERWGRGRPPREGTVEERIYRMLGRGSGETGGGGDLVDAPPEEAAERVVSFLRERGLV
jgi:electron transfer flavoprotein alpha/beta subunit